MENEVVMETEEGSPQGGNLSPLLANIYLDKSGQGYQKCRIVFVCYADDIVLPAGSERATRRLMGTSTEYLEGPLKLKASQEESHVISVFVTRAFKFLGFTLGKSGKDIYVRVHGKSWGKVKSKLKELSSRRSVQSIRPALAKIKVYMYDWLSYCEIAEMKEWIEELNERLYHRIRMHIWKR